MKNFLLDRVAHYIAKRMVRFVLLGIFNIIGISSVAGIPIVAIVDALFILLMLNDIKNTSVRAVGSSVRAVQSSVSNAADFANDITQAGVQTAQNLPMGIAHHRCVCHYARHQFDGSLNKLMVNTTQNQIKIFCSYKPKKSNKKPFCSFFDKLKANGFYRFNLN